MSEINWELLNRPFPRECIQTRKGASGKYLSYVQTSSVVQRIIDSTGNDWNFRILSITQIDDIIVAHAELEIAGNKRQACGTARMVNGNNEDVVKIAVSDSLKKAFSYYSKGYQSMWLPDFESEQPQPAAQARPAQTRPAAASTQARPAQTRPQSHTASTPVNRAVAMAGSRTFRQA